MAVVLLWSLAGCGDEKGPVKTAEVIAKGRDYDPPNLRVVVGARVTFVNRDDGPPHSAKDQSGGGVEVSPQPGPTKHDGSEVNRASRRGFATHSLFPGEKQTVVFPVAKTYKYYCAFQPNMRGTIEVVED